MITHSASAASRAVPTSMVTAGTAVLDTLDCALYDRRTPQSVVPTAATAVNLRPESASIQRQADSEPTVAATHRKGFADVGTLWAVAGGFAAAASVLHFVSGNIPLGVMWAGIAVMDMFLAASAPESRR